MAWNNKAVTEAKVRGVIDAIDTLLHKTDSDPTLDSMDRYVLDGARAAMSGVLIQMRRQA